MILLLIVLILLFGGVGYGHLGGNAAFGPARGNIFGLLLFVILVVLFVRVLDGSVML